MLTDSKSTLARLMATENLFIEQRQVRTASFDLINRVLTVPYLDGNISPELYDLLLGHEVGHALETPASGWHDSIIDHGVEKSILNVCEDARIEKKIKRRFPGIKVSFLRGYKELLDSDFFSISGKNINEFNLIDRINLHTKCGVHLPVIFSDEEKPLVREVEDTETFEQVVIVAKKIQEYMKEDIEKYKSENRTVKKKLIIKVGESEESVGETTTSEEINVDDYDEVEIEIDESSGTDDTANTEVKASGKEGYFTSETDNSFRQKEETLYRKSKGKEFVYYNIPKLYLDDIIIDYKTLFTDIRKYNKNGLDSDAKRAYSNFRNESTKVVSYLVKEFELRKNAQQMTRAKVSKTGVLDMNKLHNYKLTDDLFKKVSVVPNGKSHGLVMFIDWSGSMYDYINSTIKQLLNLCLFCKKVSIPFEVYAFHSLPKSCFENGYGNYYNVAGNSLQKPKHDDMVTNNFSLLNLLSSKMSMHDFNEAATYLVNYDGKIASNGIEYPKYMDLSGTPLNECIVASFDIIEQFKKTTKMEIINAVFLTDGEGTMLFQKYENSNGKPAIKKYFPNGMFKCIMRDPVTREQVEFDDNRTQKNALLQLLKKRENINIVGFHICDTREFRDVLFKTGKDHKTVECDMAEFRSVGHFILEDDGYDEYYALKSNKLEVDDTEFNPTSGTTRGLVSAFSKYNTGKINSRIVLNRFIGVIA